MFTCVLSIQIVHAGSIMISSRPPDESMQLKIIFAYFNQNICCGCSKQPFQRDGCYEHQRHMMILMGKTIVTILSSKTLLI